MTYRAPDEIANARKNNDPLSIFRQRVVEASLLSPDDFEREDKAIVSEIAMAVAKAKAAPMPTEADLMTDVYLSYGEGGR